MPKVLRKLRRVLSQLILKGQFLDWWYHWKILRLEHACLDNIVASTKTTNKNKSENVRVSKTTPLRRLLFIADVMWETNELIPELEKICPVDTLDLQGTIRGAAPEDYPEKVNQAVEQHLLSAPDYDAILLYARSELLSEDLFSLLRKKCHGPLIGMNLDDKVSFWPYGIFQANVDNYCQWAHLFDLNLTNSKIAATWYQNAGANSLFLPPAMHQQPLQKPPSSTEFKYPLSFLGSAKPERERIISRLQKVGIPIALFGNGWSDSEWQPDSTLIYRSSMMNLGIGYATPNLVTLKNRDFECPGSGACYLTTFNWELAEVWEIGKEILCYRSPEELIEIISWYQNRPEDCLKIARAAFKRGGNDHTWEKRFRGVFENLGLR